MLDTGTEGTGLAAKEDKLSSLFSVSMLLVTSILFSSLAALVFVDDSTTGATGVSISMGLVLMVFAFMPGMDGMPVRQEGAHRRLYLTKQPNE